MSSGKGKGKPHGVADGPQTLRMRDRSRIARFARFAWWNVMLHWCDLGYRLFGSPVEWCRLHGYAAVPDAPDSWWSRFGWKLSAERRSVRCRLASSEGRGY